MSGKITALKAQKRNPQRVNVYLDGEFAFGLARITAAWLQVGQELSDEKIAELQAQDAQEAAYQQALTLLNYRQRTAAEMRQRLAQKGLPADLVTAVIERLQRNSLLNDQRFAQDWVENRSQFRPRSARLMAAELRRHGIDQDAIAQAVQEVDEQALALQAARKQARRLAHLPEPDFRRKLTGFLARRAFPFEVARSVVEQVWSETHTDE
ncbi:MAG: RecX family transcriptional regulator [Anaerolineales bacterium]|nr:RecX family transcriptional regulator [Anaerolineales bacterium]